MTFPQARPVEWAGRACPTSVEPDGREDDAMTDQEATLRRLGKAVRKRRTELRLPVDLAHAGGPTEMTVRKIEAGRAESIRSYTKTRLERALGWPQGTVDRILSGDSEPEVDEDGATPDRNGQPCACVVGSPAWVERELVTERRINALARVFQEEMTRLLALVDAARKANGD